MDHRVARAVVALAGGCLLATGLIADPTAFGLGEMPLGAIALASAALARRWRWLRYAIGIIGLWFVLAPVLVHSTPPERLVVDTLCGLVLVALSPIAEKNLRASGVPPPWRARPA